MNEIEIQPSEVIENESIAVEKSQSKVDADIVQIDEINLADKIDDKPHSPDNLTVTYNHLIYSFIFAF